MPTTLTSKQLSSLGLSDKVDPPLLAFFKQCLQSDNQPESIWPKLAAYLSEHHYPFAVHHHLFTTLFPNWQQHPETAPVWQPSNETICHANLTTFMSQCQQPHLAAFHHWSATHYESFWATILQKLHIVFKKAPEKIVDLSQGLENPSWLPNALLNIVDSCFNAPPQATAIICQEPDQPLTRLTYQELEQLTNRIANGLIAKGFKSGDAIGIVMPMNHLAVGIYLGIIKMGGVVVSIADSFSSQEIAIRLKVANTKAVFTQTFSQWNHKKLALYEKMIAANAPPAIVTTPSNTSPTDPLQRDGDTYFADFLSRQTELTSISATPMQPMNILFSSGTTAEPKAIAWNHTTPIKVGSDAFLHQNIKPSDILAWPTNLGWMMGPWLIFASLLNQATMALFVDAPINRAFGEFIQNAQVTMLGIVPTLVASWHQTHCMEGLNWDNIKVFSSSGEASNAEEMFYLMHLANYKPVIEYCGGTEIGGAYLSGTVIQPNYPSLFSTPAFGLNLCILNDQGQAANQGEVALIPPSIGLSTQLLNADHHQIYYQGMPTIQTNQLLRRHGDEIARLNNGYYCILGRKDDCMNLGGIKISAAELERTLTGLPHIMEVAAIAIAPPGNGPSQLVVYAATSKTPPDKAETMQLMQKKISQQLNPLFKIHDLIFVTDLPKTASNKIMRRVLRERFDKPSKGHT